MPDREVSGTCRSAERYLLTLAEPDRQDWAVAEEVIEDQAQQQVLVRAQERRSELVREYSGKSLRNAQ